MTERRWSDLSREEKLDLLAGALPEGERKGVMRRVEAYFRGRPIGDFIEATNVVLRESHRAQHGDTTRWDEAAAVGGVRVEDRP